MKDLISVENSRKGTNTTYHEKVRKLFRILPRVRYEDQGERKIFIPLDFLLNDELISGFNQVKRVVEETTGSDEGVSFNFLASRGINLPIREGSWMSLMKKAHKNLSKRWRQA